jgi:hypothetical protein
MLHTPAGRLEAEVTCEHGPQSRVPAGRANQARKVHKGINPNKHPVTAVVNSPH